MTIKKAINLEKIAQAYKTIRAGGLAIIPSRVGYTLLGNSEAAIQKMFLIKGRPLTKPCVVLTTREILPQIAQVPPHHVPFVERMDSEGMLCGFILKRKAHPLFSSLSPYTDRNTQKPDGTSCFVIHGGGYIEYLIEHALQDGTIVVGSSANKSGTGNEGVFTHIPEAIRSQVDYALEDDEFVHQEYNPQTREQGVMIDFTAPIPVMIRTGLRHMEIQKALEEHTRIYRAPLEV